MAALASFEDFETRHGEFDRELVEALLADASAVIRAAAADSEAEWAADDAPNDVEVPAVIRAVCIAVAYRAITNPDSVAREELGDMARTYRGGTEPDALWLTKSERALVRKTAGTAVRSIALETPYSGPISESHSMDFYPDGL